MDTRETLKSWVTSSCEMLSIILNQGVYPEEAEARDMTPDQLMPLGLKGLRYPMLLTGLEGQMTLFLPQEDALRMVDLLVGGDGNAESSDLTDLHLNVLQEALVQLTSSLGEILTRVCHRQMTARLGEPRLGPLDDFGAGGFLWMKFPLSLDDGNNLSLVVLVPGGLVSELGGSTAQESRSEPAASKVQQARFEPLPALPNQSQAPKLDLIMDVPLQVQVVLGRTSVLVSELIHLGEGSILELDRLAGEPVELYVHDRLVAYAEVVVIDERFGVKVLDLARDQRQKGRSTVVG